MHFSGKGHIEIKNATIPELKHVENGTTFDTPNWSDITADTLLTPQHVRRVIVYIFEALM